MILEDKEKHRHMVAAPDPDSSSDASSDRKVQNGHLSAPGISKKRCCLRGFGLLLVLKSLPFALELCLFELSRINASLLCDARVHVFIDYY